MGLLQLHRKLHDGTVVTLAVQEDSSIKMFDTVGRRQTLSLADAQALSEALAQCCEEAARI